jgi:hypothetical protein
VPTTTLSPAPSPARDERAVAAPDRGSRRGGPPGAAGRDTDGFHGSAGHRRGAAILGSRLLPVAVVAVPMVVLVVSQLRQAGVAGPAISDYGVLELGTAAAGRGEQFLGPYSRYGWNHPGPFLFYWNTPFWAATGRHLGGLTLAAAVLNTLTLSGVVAVAGRVGGRVAAWCAAGGVLIFLARYDIERMREAWNPTLTVAMTALTIALSVAVAAGRRRALPVLALAASAAVQIHAGTGPTVVAVVAVAVAVAVVADRRCLRPWARPALLTVAVVGSLWALPAVEQFGGGRDDVGDGNVTELVSFFAASESPVQPRTDVLHAVGKLVAAQDPHLSFHAGPASGVIASVPTPNTAEVAGVWGLVAVLLVGLGVAIATRSRALGAWAALPLVALAAAVVSARAVDGEFYLYLVAFVSGTALTAWIAAAVVVVDIAGRARRASARRRGRAVAAVPTTDDRPSPLNPVLAAIVAVAAGAGVAASIAPAESTDPYAERMRSTAAAGLLPDLRDTIAAAGADVVLLRIAGPGMWTVAAPIADELEDEGLDVRVDAEWTFMFGEHRRAAGDEDLVVSVLDSADTAILGDLPVIDEAGGVTLAVGGSVVAESSATVGDGAPASG